MLRVLRFIMLKFIKSLTLFNVELIKKKRPNFHRIKYCECRDQISKEVFKLKS